MWWVNSPQLTNTKFGINVLYNLVIWAKNRKQQGKRAANVSLQ